MKNYFLQEYKRISSQLIKLVSSLQVLHVYTKYRTLVLCPWMWYSPHRLGLYHILTHKTKVLYRTCLAYYIYIYITWIHQPLLSDEAWYQDCICIKHSGDLKPMVPLVRYGTISQKLSINFEKLICEIPREGSDTSSEGDSSKLASKSDNT